MRAVLSGRAAIALLNEGNQWHSISYEEPERLVERQAAEAEVLLRDANDRIWLDNVSIEQVRDTLADVVDTTEALDCVLYLLDGSLQPETRDVVALELEELVAWPEIVLQVEAILLAHQFPASADFAGAIAACVRTESHQTLRHLREWHSLQVTVRTVRDAWLRIPFDRFGGIAQRSTVEGQFIKHGVFASIVRSELQSAALTTLQFQLSSNASLKGDVPGLVGIINDWLRPLKHAMTVTDVSTLAPNRNTDDGEDRENEPEKERRSINRAKVKDNVDSQKANICDAIRSGNSERASRITEELIQYQLANGGKRLVSNSLCGLAIEAQSVGNSQLQLWFTSQAVELVPDDGWAWAQHGKSLLNLGRFDDANPAFQNAIDFGTGDTVVVAKTGRAEILKAQGDLPAALAAFDAVIAKHQENVVAKNGRAEVLKAQGDLPAALAAFDAVIAKHPEDVVAKNGRAEVLKAQGDLPAALAAFDAVIAKHPENVVAKSGRAEVLKAQGDLPAALAAFDAVIAKHPEDAVAKTGRAEVLKAQGDLPAALAAFNAVIAKHPEDVVAKNGRNTVRLIMGRYDEALAELPTIDPRTRQEWIGFHIRGMIEFRRGELIQAESILTVGATECPFSDCRAYFESALAALRLRQGRLQDARELAERPTERRLVGPMTTLLVHIKGRQQEFESARQSFEVLPEPPNAAVAEMFAELERRYIKRQPAAFSEDWLFEREINYLMSC
jgi:tetratricopeptide (TPR) repeat protein